MRRVLIVDDEPSNLKVMRLLMSFMEVEVREACSGADALIEVEAFQPHLILSDVSMPGVSGLDLAREVRAQRPAIKLVAVSGQISASDRLAARLAGFDAFLAKPIDVRAAALAIVTILDGADTSFEYAQ